MLAEDHERLLEKLIALRREHHLTQAEVAGRMAVTQPAVAQFEQHDANPRLSTVRRYALAVGAVLATDVIDDTAMPAPSLRQTLAYSGTGPQTQWSLAGLSAGLSAGGRP